MSNGQTIGMKVDAILRNLDSTSSTRLYGMIVAVTVVISFLLLGSGVQEVPNTAPVAVMPVKKSTSTSNTTTREPRWFVLKYLNYAAIVGFLYSVVSFGLDAQVYLEDSTKMLQFLVGWSLFLCYFFGFFGISFVDTDDLIHQDNNNNAATAMEQQQNNNHSATTSISNKNKSLIVHKPVPCSTPVCSDPTSFTSSSQQQQQQATTTTNKLDIAALSDEQVAQMVVSNKIKDHLLEKLLHPTRAVVVRRLAMETKLASLGHDPGALQQLPHAPNLDYARVHGANCEVVIGYVPIPVGMVGPMTVNDESVYIPMATTEGCLVASTQRGAKAISLGSGARAVVLKDGITRAPCVRMESAQQAAALCLWCQEPNNFALLKQAFESTTSFGKLQSCSPTVAGRNVYLRLVCFSGDAMGMNMVSKGSLAVIDLLQRTFPSLTLVALSGNMCTDKKAAATNWLEGRGKSVVVEATIPKKVVQTTLKTTVASVVETNLHKNLVGSAMAGTIGGFNAHAANIVTAVFLATGQDPAQNVESSNCITLLEETPEGDLWISCTMPSLEVGTVGGGTSLPAQASCLKAIGVQGGCATLPGANAKKLAMVVASATMAGELSLLAALAANTLVQAHMKHNRKTTTTKK